jgi:hypothetical protein
MSDSFDVIMAACTAADSTLRDFDAAPVPAGAPLGFIPLAAAD